MQLLYCSNGVVIGVHGSEQQVTVGDYGAAGMRIIPYDQPLTTLTRIGAPPPPPWKPSQGDTRPYAQPTETPQLLIGYAAQVRYDISIAGVSFAAISGPVPLKCDRVSQSLVGNLVQYAATLSPTDPIDFTQDGIHYPLQASEVVALFAAINGLIQQARTIEAACIADQNLPTPTMLTYDDIDAQFASLESRTLRAAKKPEK